MTFNPNSLLDEAIDQLASQDYAVIQNLFDDDILHELLDVLTIDIAHEALKTAGIGKSHQFNKNIAIRNDKIKWLEKSDNHPREKAFFNKIDELCQYLNYYCYTGIADYEFHYACFKPGNYYKKHLDSFSHSNKRKISVICYLNKDWHVSYGGELTLHINDETIDILPQWGTTVLMKSEIVLHEVKMATKERLSVTGWLK